MYMAPEVYARDYNVEADMWSAGVMLYQLFAKRFPFWDNLETCKASKLEEVAVAVNEAPITFDYGPWLRMSVEGREFMAGCLQRDPHRRMTVEQALAHPWLVRALAEPAAAQQQQQPVVSRNNIVNKMATVAVGASVAGMVGGGVRVASSKARVAAREVTAAA